MLPILTTIFLIIATLGGGRIVIQILRLQNELSLSEQFGFAFVMGIGLIGWILFFPGLFGAFNTLVFFGTSLLFSLGIFLFDLRKIPIVSTFKSFGTNRFIFFVLCLVIIFDFAEGLSPPADADTMAYHFETPRQFVSSEKIFPVFRAFDGITQLLTHLTYAAAFALGKKESLNLWAMITGWGLPVIFFIIAKSHMATKDALIGATLLITTPAIIYSGGTGQVEPIAAMFALVAIFGLIKSTQNICCSQQRMRWILFAGINAGFFAGTKITGLIFLFSVGTIILFSREGIKHFLAFSFSAAVVGSQWYLFNWHHTGDPLFPLLWEYVTLKPGILWDKEVAAAANRAFASENPIPRDIFWFFAYPIRTIIQPLPAFESLRTGLGPTILLGFPFLLVTILQRCEKEYFLLQKNLALTAFIFYAIWFFFGPSLRVRHLLPIYPLLLLIIMLGFSQIQKNYTELKPILYAGFIGVICIQLCGHIVFSKKYVEHILSGNENTKFLEKNISGYGVIKWINSNLTKDDHILINKRDWFFYLNIPYVSVANTLQTKIAIHQKPGDIKTFFRQLVAAKVTYAAIPENIISESSDVTLGLLLSKIEKKGCLKKIKRIKGLERRSRTLSFDTDKNIIYGIYKFQKNICQNL